MSKINFAYLRINIQAQIFYFFPCRVDVNSKGMCPVTGSVYGIAKKVYELFIFFSEKKNQKPRRCKNSLSPYNIFLGLIASISIRFHTPLYFCLRTEIQADQGAQTV